MTEKSQTQHTSELTNDSHQDNENHRHEELRLFHSLVLRLMQELIEVQKSLQGFLKQMVDEHKNLIECLKGALPSQGSTIYGSAYDCSSLDSDIKPNDMRHGRIVPQISITETMNPDKQLVHWLESHGVDDHTIQKFILEEYTFNDVLQSMAREDLRRLNLKGGIELRLWNAIIAWRKENKPAIFNHRKPPIDRKRSYNSFESLNHNQI